MKIIRNIFLTLILSSLLYYFFLLPAYLSWLFFQSELKPSIEEKRVIWSQIFAYHHPMQGELLNFVSENYLSSINENQDLLFRGDVQNDLNYFYHLWKEEEARHKNSLNVQLRLMDFSIFTMRYQETFDAMDNIIRLAPNKEYLRWQIDARLKMMGATSP